MKRFELMFHFPCCKVGAFIAVISMACGVRATDITSQSFVFNNRRVSAISVAGSYSGTNLFVGSYEGFPDSAIFGSVHNDALIDRILATFGTQTTPVEVASVMGPDLNPRVVSSSNSNDGTVWLTYTYGNLGHYQGIEWTKSFSIQGSPLFALPDGISTATNGAVNILGEVRPTIAARSLVRISVPFDGIGAASMQSYALPVGASVIDQVPTGDGGFLILAGTEDAASSYYLHADGALGGPFFVGAASQVAYDPSAGGFILTAGSLPGGNMRFTRGPLTGPPSDTNTQALPFQNQGVRFTCASDQAGIKCWWGGSYTTLAGDENGFVTSTSSNAALALAGSKAVGTSGSDEAVHSLVVEPAGVAVVAADGQMIVLDTLTGNVMAQFPTVPDLDIQFRKVSAKPYAPGTHGPRDQGFPYSQFGVVSHDSLTDTSSMELVSLPGELRAALVGRSSYVGGTSPTLYVQIYQPVASALFAISSSSANVTGPATISFSGSERTKNVKLTTQPVATAEDVTVTVGTGLRPVTTTFRLMPPTPQLLAPNSQAVSGGASAIMRLTLNGKAPAAGLIVPLNSSGVEVTVPASVTLPAGQYSRSFLVHTKPVSTTVSRTVSATYAGVSATASIIVDP